MSEEKTSEHQWELCKENIQPLKSGRRVENLNESLLKLHDDSYKREMKQIQEQFEENIRTYSGADPLETHHRYINWLKATFPTGCKELVKVIENCLREFRHEDRYKNDVRYIQAWLNYIEICGDEKLTVFKTLFDRGIGTMTAELYLAWAAAYEAGNNFQRAREVFEHGTACGAQPSTLLKRKFEQFCQRALAHEFASSESAAATPTAAAAAAAATVAAAATATAATAAAATAAAAAPSGEGVRQAMASLKLRASGPRGEAVVDPVRVGPHVVSSAPRGLNAAAQGCSSARPTDNFLGSKVNIFSDSVVGGHGAGGIGGGLGSEYSLALHSPAAHSTVAVDKLMADAAARRKENELCASRWTDAPLAPRGAPVTATPDSAAFTIYTDEHRRSPEGRQLTSKGPTPGIRLSAMKAAPEAVAAHHAFALLEADTAAAAGGVRRPERAMQLMDAGRAFAGAAGDETPAMAAGKGTMEDRQSAVSSALSGPGTKILHPKGPTGTELSLEELRAQRHRAHRGAVARAEPQTKMMIKMDAVYPKGSAAATEMSFEELRALYYRAGHPAPAVKSGPHVKMVFHLDSVLPDGPSGREMSFEELRARRYRERCRTKVQRRPADSEKLPLATRTRRREAEAELEVEAARLADRRRELEARRSAAEALEQEMERREAEVRRRSAQAEAEALKAEEREREAEARCVELTKKTTEVEAILLAKQQQLAMLEQKVAEQEDLLKALVERREQEELASCARELSAMDVSNSRNRKRAGSLLCTPRHDSAILAATPGLPFGRPNRKHPRGPAETDGDEDDLRTPSRAEAEAVASQQGFGVTPTVNTKFAINIMQQLFDSSARQPETQDTLCLEEGEEEGLNHLPASTAGRVPPGALACPFEVFEEHERTMQRGSLETGRRRPLEASGSGYPPDLCGATPVTLPMSPVERAYLRSARRHPDAKEASPPAEFNIFSDPSINGDQKSARPVKKGTAGGMAFKIFSGPSISEDDQPTQQPVKSSHSTADRGMAFKIFSGPSISEDDQPTQQPVKSSHSAAGGMAFKIFSGPSISEDDQPTQQPVKSSHSAAGGMAFKILSDDQAPAQSAKESRGNFLAKDDKSFLSFCDDQQPEKPVKGSHDVAGAMPFKIFSDPSITDDQQHAQPIKSAHATAGVVPFKIFSNSSITDDDQQAEKPTESHHGPTDAMPFKIFSNTSKTDQQPAKKSCESVKPVGFSEPPLRNKQQHVAQEGPVSAGAEKRPGKLTARTPGVGSDLAPGPVASYRWSERQWGPPVGASDSGPPPAAMPALGGLLETDILTDMADHCWVNDPDLTFAPEYHSTQNVKKILANLPPDFQDIEAPAPASGQPAEASKPAPAEAEPVATPAREPSLEELDSAAKEEMLLRRNLTAIQEVSDEKDSRSNHSDVSSYGLGFSRRSLARRSSPVVPVLYEIREATRETSSVFQSSASHLRESWKDQTLEAKRSLRTDPGAVARQMETERSFDASRHTGSAAQASCGATEADAPSASEFPADLEGEELEESGLFRGELRNTALLRHLAGQMTGGDTEVEEMEPEEEEAEAEAEAPRAELDRYGDHTILIDEPALHHMEEMAERTAYFTTNYVITDIKDPYKGRVVKQLMTKVMPELQESPDFVALTTHRTSRDRLVFNESELLVDTSFSRVKGGFGEVVLVRDPLDDSKWILKKHNSRYPLEFYFLREARKRLRKAASVHEQSATWVDVSESICFARKLYCDSANSFLLLQHYPLGTILTFRNRLHKMVEPLAVYFTLELLHIIDQLHRVGIIHGDLKPDNIVVRNRFPHLREDYNGGLPGQKTHVVCLIDFGRSIDLKFFGRNACFLSEGGVKGFECIEMKTGRPWSFQVDLFNVASTIYAIIKGVYMTVTFKEDKWVPTKFMEVANKRLWKLGTYWQSLLETLINVPSCDPVDYPNMAELRAPLENYLIEHRAFYNRHIDIPNSLL